MSKSSQRIAASSHAPADCALETAPHPQTDMDRLLTIRIVGLLDLMRRSGTLANRRSFDLSSVEWRIMNQVGAHAPLSLNDLAELLGLDRGQLSRAVKAMVTRDLLDRKRKPGGPAIVITLTDEGRALYARMIDLAAARNRFLTRDIPPEDLARTLEVLDAIRERANALLELERSYGGP